MTPQETSSETDESSRTDVERWYDNDFHVTDSEHTTLDEVPETADIEADGITHEGIGLSFVIERAMLDPDATVVPVDTGQ